MASCDRYLPATILGGHLHVRGIPDWGPWDPARLEWEPEEYVDMFVGKDLIHRKAGTREELDAIMKEPTREVWIHESLVDEARRLWEEMRDTLSLTSFRFGLSVPFDYAILYEQCPVRISGYKGVASRGPRRGVLTRCSELT